MHLDTRSWAMIVTELKIRNTHDLNFSLRFTLLLLYANRKKGIVMN